MQFAPTALAPWQVSHALLQHLTRINTPKRGFLDPALFALNVQPAPVWLTFQKPSENPTFRLKDGGCSRVRLHSEIGDFGGNKGDGWGYSESVLLDGDRLIGLQRGERATKAIDHESGTQVHVGRTIEFVVPILHAKDDWNG